MSELDYDTREQYKQEDRAEARAALANYHWEQNKWFLLREWAETEEAEEIIQDVLVDMTKQARQIISMSSVNQFRKTYENGFFNQIETILLRDYRQDICSDDNLIEIFSQE